MYSSLVLVLAISFLLSFAFPHPYPSGAEKVTKVPAARYFLDDGAAINAPAVADAQLAEHSALSSLNRHSLLRSRFIPTVHRTQNFVWHIVPGVNYQSRTVIELLTTVLARALDHDDSDPLPRHYTSILADHLGQGRLWFFLSMLYPGAVMTYGDLGTEARNIIAMIAQSGPGHLMHGTIYDLTGMAVGAFWLSVTGPST